MVGYTSMTVTVPTVRFGSDLLPWLGALAASSVPRLNDRTDVQILEAVEKAASANGVRFWTHGELPESHFMISDEEMDRDYLGWISRPWLYLQVWDKRAGKSCFERVDIARRPGGYLPSDV